MRTRIFPLPGSREPRRQRPRDFRKPLSGQRQFHPFEQPVRVRIARSERQKPRASNEAFVCPFRRVAPSNALGEVLLNKRMLPDGGRRKQTNHLVAIRNSLALDSPPDQQRNLRINGILVALEQFTDDRQGILPRQAFCRTGELTANHRASLCAGARNQTLLNRGRDLLRSTTLKGPTVLQASRPQADAGRACSPATRFYKCVHCCGPTCRWSQRVSPACRTSPRRKPPRPGQWSNPPAETRCRPWSTVR